MARTSARAAALILAATLLAAGCTGSAPAPTEKTVLDASPVAKTTISVSGYPLDRSLHGLITHPDVSAVLLVTNPVKGQPYWSTPDGKAPAYIVEGRNQNADEVKRVDSIMTPVTVTVQAALSGGIKPGSTITLVFTGGTVGDVAMTTDTDVAPDMDDLFSAGRLLVAGPATGTTMSPYFVYSVGSGTRHQGGATCRDHSHAMMNILPRPVRPIADVRQNGAMPPRPASGMGRQAPIQVLRPGEFQ